MNCMSLKTNYFFSTTNKNDTFVKKVLHFLFLYKNYQYLCVIIQTKHKKQ